MLVLFHTFLFAYFLLLAEEIFQTYKERCAFAKEHN